MCGGNLFFEVVPIWQWILENDMYGSAESAESLLAVLTIASFIKRLYYLSQLRGFWLSRPFQSWKLNSP